MADGVQSRLIDQIDTTVINQAWKPVIVYLNGQYWASTTCASGSAATSSPPMRASPWIGRMT